MDAPTRTPLLDVPWFDVVELLAGDDPLTAFAALLDGGPLARSDFGLHILTYDGCLDLLRDDRFHTDAAQLLDSAGITDPVTRTQWLTSLLGSRPADHDRMRRLVSPSFTPRAIADLRSYVVELADTSATAAIERGSLEVMSDLATAIPPAVFCRMIGAPEADAPVIGRLSAQILEIFGRRPELAPSIETATHELVDYVLGFVDLRRRSPEQGDLISNLLAAEESGDRLTTDELVALASEVLEASTDNTSSQLALVLHTAAEDPGRWQALRADPSTIPGFVEEACRLWPRIVCNAKVAAGDESFAGVAVPSGTPVWATVPSAHRDPAAFTDPLRFDPNRATKATNLNYGAGGHYCVGVHLARLEMCGAIEALTQRWRSIEPLGPIELDISIGAVTVRALHLAVEPA